jgi:WD40 repeat protein
VTHPWLNSHMASPLPLLFFRSDEAPEAASSLRQALALAGIPVTLLSLESSGDVGEQLSCTSPRAPLVIVMGTKTLWKEVVDRFSSRDGLSFATQRETSIFLINMCNDGEEPRAQLHVPISDFVWMPDPVNHSKVPAGLVRQIMSKLALSTSVVQSAAAASPKRKFPADSRESAAVVEEAAPSTKQHVPVERAAATTWKELLKLEGHCGGVLAVLISPDGTRIVSASAAKYEESQGSTSDAEGDDESEESVSSTEGEEESEHNAIRIWDAITGQQLLTLEGHDAPVDALAISLDGFWLVSGSYDMTIRVWDAHSGEQLMVLSGHASVVRAVAISPDGRRIVSGSGDNTIRLWDAHNGAQLRVLEGHTSLVSAVAISPDGSKIVSGSWDATVRVWDLYTAAPLMVLKGHTGWVTTVAIAHDGQRIVSGSADKTIRVWSALSAEQQLVLAGHAEGICAVAFFPDDCRLASGSSDNTIRVWDAHSHRQLALLEGHTEAVYAMAISSTGNDKIVSGSADKTIHVWSIE